MKNEFNCSTIVSSFFIIILKTFPDIKEKFKRGVPWYEEKFYVVALKDHVNLGWIWVGFGLGLKFNPLLLTTTTVNLPEEIVA